MFADRNLSRESNVPALAGWWLSGLSPERLQDATIEKYGYDSRAVAEEFREIRLKELSVRVVDSAILDLTRIDPRRARRVHDTLGWMCDEAVRVSILDDNPPGRDVGDRSL